MLKRKRAQRRKKIRRLVGDTSVLTIRLLTSIQDKVFSFCFPWRPSACSCVPGTTMEGVGIPSQEQKCLSVVIFFLFLFHFLRMNIWQGFFSYLVHLSFVQRSEYGYHRTDRSEWLILKVKYHRRYTVLMERARNFCVLTTSLVIHCIFFWVTTLFDWRSMSGYDTFTYELFSSYILYFC